MKRLDKVSTLGMVIEVIFGFSERMREVKDFNSGKDKVVNSAKFWKGGNEGDVAVLVGRVVERKYVHESAHACTQNTS